VTPEVDSVSAHLGLAHEHEAAAPDDPRWDTPLFSRWADDHPDRLPHRSHDGTVGPGYPRAWSQCPSCRGSGINAVGRACPFCHGAKAIKHLVRALAGHRCVRCGHPYLVGQPQFWAEPVKQDSVEELAALQLFETEPVDEPRVTKARPVHWSPCDRLCTHGGRVRVRFAVGAGRRSNHWAELEVARDDWYLLAEPPSEVHAAWRILTVHHLNEDKGDCRWWNLVALCQRCHLSVQSRVQMDRVWPYEHTPWFKPYVAGFYAWRYEGESLSRAEVEERMDELLAYERHG
jgi:hypothetical protein